MILLRRIWVPVLFSLCLLVLWNVFSAHSNDSAQEIQPSEHGVARLPANVDSGEDVLTYHNDNFRTGQYLREASLTPSNLHSANFGKVGFLPVSGLVDYGLGFDHLAD